MYNKKKIDEFKNNPKNFLTTKVSVHIPSGISRSLIYSFRNIENKYYVYRRKDYLKKFGEFLRERAMKMNEF